MVSRSIDDSHGSRLWVGRKVYLNCVLTVVTGPAAPIVSLSTCIF